MIYSDYFGENGYFAQACGKVKPGGDLPEAVREHAKTLDRSDTAYRLGFAFSLVLKEAGVEISVEHLEMVAKNKISYGDPAVFLRAFRDARR